MVWAWDYSHIYVSISLAGLPSLFLHTATDQKLEVGMAWGSGEGAMLEWICFQLAA